MSQQRVLSGVKPTGRPHIGNYFGAMKQFVDLQEDHENFIFIADYHALISAKNPKELAQDIVDIAIDYLAIGLNPKKTTLFQQSRLSAHTELAWIFNTVTPFTELTRAHAYKDAVAKNEKINLGLFQYPVLMAADILLYDADMVPVGRDQVQHVEIANMIVKKFNNLYGNVLKPMKEYVLSNVAIVPGLDGRKMSKSYGNTIELFEEANVLKKKIMSIKTGSAKLGQPLETENDVLFALHKLFATTEELNELRDRYQSGKIGYKESKELLFERAETFIAPLREKRTKIAKNRRAVLKILEKGAKAAGKISNRKLQEVKQAIGVEI